VLESATDAGEVLAGRRILVVEDEFLDADEVVRTLRGSGAEILGAVPTVEKALALIHSSPAFDAAVIDVSLAGELAYPIAEALLARETPFVFTTVFRRDELPERYREAPHCAKPMQPPVLLRQLRRALERRHPSGGASDISVWVQRIARHRDREAFGELFLAVAPKVKGYMLRGGLPHSVAEELAQDVLLTVWRKAEAFDPGRATAMAWIFTIARNLRVDRHRREHAGDPPQPDWTAFQRQPTPEEIVGASRDSRRVHAALGDLPPGQAEVLRRAFLDAQPHSEIARALGLPLGTVKSRLRLAMARLRSTLGNEVN
jgi:RNA polymerase sigma-70 factor (ECF subfamily)